MYDRVQELMIFFVILTFAVHPIAYVTIVACTYCSSVGIGAECINVTVNRIFKTWVGYKVSKNLYSVWHHSFFELPYISVTVGNLPIFQNIFGRSDDVCRCCQICCPCLAVFSDHMPKSQITPPLTFRTLVTSLHILNTSVKTKCLFLST